MDTPKIFRVPERFHRIAVKEITEMIDCTAPKSSVLAVPLEGAFGVPPAPAVKISTSC
ncbi:Uncharacterised protein [Mycobacterium tuberculosis]|uniref:Uncharacterized protein n=1 Tax=Mycobacterium tuberculosis TaxID=1773 RepID=A0A654TDK2_MYCTX|nr:Uncharacterised protein [Mycobacterium tuberculosis]CFE72399.1 Uncharacterised protein [Mycobacterium tuberculosis]CFR66888.1 Uncharacterised protein [Mycobacterium tuberculosis]CFS29305.1 Uncharacterised protein [Mycobacterium tuberculosis]CKS10495.1 Uncharacterised protein [Mycobacterium tuberculosis]